MKPGLKTLLVGVALVSGPTLYAVDEIRVISDIGLPLKAMVFQGNEKQYLGETDESGVLAFNTENRCTPGRVVYAEPISNTSNYLRTSNSRYCSGESGAMTLEIRRVLLANNVSEFAEGAEEEENYILAAQARHTEFTLYQRLASDGSDVEAEAALDSMYENLAKAVDLEPPAAYQCLSEYQAHPVCELSSEFAERLQQAYPTGVRALILDNNFFETATQVREVDILYGQAGSALGFQ